MYFSLFLFIHIVGKLGSLTDGMMLVDAVVESVERRSPVRNIKSSIPSWVKPMTYKIDTSLVLSIIRLEQGLVGPVQDTVTEWDIGG